MTIEEILFHLEFMSNKSRKQIIDFVQSNIISFQDLYKFYSKFGKFPNSKECFFIYYYDLNILLNL